MDETELKKLMQLRRSEDLKRGWRCPDEIQLAAYVAQHLDSSAGNAIETHVVDCNYCLSQVAFLAQSADWSNSVEVPPHLLSGARNLVARKRGRTLNVGWRWAVPTVALACLALVFVVIVLRLRGQEPSPRPTDTLVAQQRPPEIAPSPPLTPALPAHAAPTQSLQAPKTLSTETPTVRNSAAEPLPILITPRDGAVLRRDQLEFRWTPVPDAVFYEVQVMSTDGDMVFEERTENAWLRPGAAVPLLAGTKYFVVTRAHLRQGKTAKSSLVSFRLAE